MLVLSRIRHGKRERHFIRENTMVLNLSTWIHSPHLSRHGSRQFLAALLLTLGVGVLVACGGGGPSRAARKNAEQLEETAACEGCDLADVYLGDMDLSGVNLSGADLTRAVLAGSNLEGANLSGAVLKDALLMEVNLKDADLSKAQILDTSLTDANLQGVKLLGATLVEVDLDGADLTGAEVGDLVFDETTVAFVSIASFILPDGSTFGDAPSSSTPESESIAVEWNSLTKVCEGTGIEGTQAYAPGQAGLAGFNVAGFFQTDSGWQERHEEAGEISDFVPYSVSDDATNIALVACVSASPRELVNTCEYQLEGSSGQTAVQRYYRRQIEVTLRAAATGEVVDTLVLDSKDDGVGACPETYVFREGETQVDVDPLSRQQREARDWVDKQAAGS